MNVTQVFRTVLTSSSKVEPLLARAWGVPRVGREQPEGTRWRPLQLCWPLWQLDMGVASAMGSHAAPVPTATHARFFILFSSPTLLSFFPKMLTEYLWGGTYCACDGGLAGNRGQAKDFS